MLVFFALALVVLLGFCGLAVDVGLLQLKQLQLQNAADAAAKAAINALSGGTSAWTAAARADSTANGFTDGMNGVSVLPPVHPTTGLYAGNSLALTATISQTVNPVFFAGAQTVSAQSTALAPASNCMYLLSQVQTGILSFDSHNQSVSSDCGMYLRNGYSLTDASGGQIYVSSMLCTNNCGVVTPAPLFNVSAQDDPLLGSLPTPPVPTGCDHTGLTHFQDSANTVVAQAGVYCGDLLIDHNSHVQFGSGFYYILGNLNINNATVTSLAGGVTFYLTQNNSYHAGTANINNATFNLSAQTSGPYQGILFYSDRAQHTGQIMLNIFQNQNSCTLDGIVYLPGQQIFASQTPLRGNSYFGIVADYFNLHNVGLTLKSDYSSLAGGNPFHPAGGGLVQ